MPIILSGVEYVMAIYINSSLNGKFNWSNIEFMFICN